MRSKKMGPLEQFYIDNNLHLTDTELARTTGCSVKQVKTRRNKGGLNREGNPRGEPEKHALQQADPERQNQLQKEAALAAQQQALPEPTNQRPAPAMRIDALIARKNGVTAMTGPAAELSDMFDGIAPDADGKLKKAMYESSDPFNDPTRVHKIKP